MNPLIAALPAASRAVLPSVLGAVASGASQARVVSLIRQAGLTYSARNPWAGVLSYARAARTYNDRLSFITAASKPNIDRIPLSLGDTRRKFAWTVRLDLRNDEGDRYETFVTVSTDNPNMTVDQIKKAAMRHGQEYDFGIGGEVYAAVLVGGTKRWDA